MPLALGEGMQKTRILYSTTLLCAALLVGCGLEAPSPCDDLATKMEQCFGVAAAPATCDPAVAAELALSDCASLVQYSVTRAKSDGDSVDAQVRAAIREAIKQALEAGLDQALAQVLAALGDLDQWRFYLLFKEDSSQAAAYASAAQFATLLTGTEGMQPFVYEKETCWGCAPRYWVLHGPCPIPLTKIGSTVVDLVLENPGLLSLMGGSGEMEPVDFTDTSYETNISLPLQILPMGEDAPAAFGCLDEA